MAFRGRSSPSKLNSILELVECLGVEKVEHFKKRSSRVLRELFLILGSQVKENLLKRIKKSSFFGILKDEVTEIANIQTLVTFMKFYDEENDKSRNRIY